MSEEKTSKQAPPHFSLHVVPGQHVGPIPFGLPLFQFVEMFLTQHASSFASSSSTASPHTSSTSTSNNNTNSSSSSSSSCHKIAPLFAGTTISHPRFPGSADVEVELPSCGLILCFDAHSHRFVSAWFTPAFATAAVEVLIGGRTICKTQSSSELPTLRRIVEVLGPTQPGRFRTESLYDVVYPGTVISFEIPTEELRQQLRGSNTAESSHNNLFRKQETGFKDGTTPVAQRIVWHSTEPGSSVSRGVKNSSSSSSSSSSAPPPKLPFLATSSLGSNASLAEVAVAGWAASMLQESSSFLAAEVIPGVGVRFHCRPVDSNNNINSSSNNNNVAGYFNYNKSQSISGNVGESVIPFLTNSPSKLFTNSPSRNSPSTSASGNNNNQHRRTLKVCEIFVGQSPQDVISLFGQPQIVWPHISRADNVVGHAVMLVLSRQAGLISGGGGSRDRLGKEGSSSASSSSSASGAGGEGGNDAVRPGFSFCYPALGFNVIFNSANRVESIMLSNAAPGHEFFLRYARCPFALFGSDSACLGLLGISPEVDPDSSSSSSSQMQQTKTLVPGLSANAPGAGGGPSSSSSSSNNNNNNNKKKSGNNNTNNNNNNNQAPPPPPTMQVNFPSSSSSNSIENSNNQNTTVRKIFDSYSNWSEVAGHVAGTAREKLRRIPLSTAHEDAEMTIIDRAAKIPPGLSISAPEGALRVVPMHGLCFTVASSGAIASVQVGRLPRRMAKTTVGRSGHRIRLPVRSDASGADFASATAEPRTLSSKTHEKSAENAAAAAAGGGAGEEGENIKKPGGTMLSAFVVDDVEAEFDDCAVDEDPELDFDSASSSIKTSPNSPSPPASDSNSPSPNNKKKSPAKEGEEEKKEEKKKEQTKEEEEEEESGEKEKEDQKVEVKVESETGEEEEQQGQLPETISEDGKSEEKFPTSSQANFHASAASSESASSSSSYQNNSQKKKKQQQHEEESSSPSSSHEDTTPLSLPALEKQNHHEDEENQEDEEEKKQVEEEHEQQDEEKKQQQEEQQEEYDEEHHAVDDEEFEGNDENEKSPSNYSDSKQQSRQETNDWDDDIATPAEGSSSENKLHLSGSEMSNKQGSSSSSASPSPMKAQDTLSPVKTIEQDRKSQRHFDPSASSETQEGEKAQENQEEGEQGEQEEREKEGISPLSEVSQQSSSSTQSGSSTGGNHQRKPSTPGSTVSSSSSNNSKKKKKRR